MAKKTVFGLKAITIGDIAADGGMGATLTEIFGNTVVGSATLESTEPTTQDVPIEESSLAIENITTDNGSFTLKASTYNIGAIVMKTLFGGSISGANGVATFGAITGGSGYVNGTYLDVPLTGGTGTGATADITVSAGAVSALTLVDKGIGYTAADVLSASAANLGGSGSGFSVPAATIASVPETWAAPVDGIRPTVEKSVICESSGGTKFSFVRMKMSAGLSVVFTKDRLGQINWTGTVLQPTKANTAPWKIDYAA